MIPDVVKKQCVRMYLEGMGFRAIGRFLNISYVSVHNYVKAAGKKLKKLKESKVKMNATAIPITRAELDEVHTYVDKKKLRMDMDCC